MFFRTCTLIAILLAGFTHGLRSQTAEAYRRAAEAAMAEKNYYAASRHYTALVRKKPDDLHARWGLANCARLQSAFPEAEKQYTKLGAMRPGIESVFPEFYLYLGEVRQRQGHYEKAIAAFQEYLKQNVSTARRQEAVEAIEKCQWAVEASRQPALFTVKHLGRAVNSPYSDFAPLLRNDTLLFSSYRFDEKRKGKNTGNKITRLAQSINGKRARELSRGWPITDTAHVAHTALTADGHYMFFTVCKNQNQQDIRCELWLAVKARNNRWEWLFRLPEPVNIPGYTTTQPSVGFDSTYRGEVLWFASDRPGGSGGLDIWKMPLDSIYFCPCNLPVRNKQMPPPGPFLQPVPVSEVNSPQNDITPFFHSATRRLYFASNGREGFGGYDLYFARQQGEKGWSAPENAGQALNTSYDDLYPFLNEEGDKGYFSSNRPGTFYLDESSKTCCLDIFSFEKIPPLPEKPRKDTIPLLAGKDPKIDTPLIPPPLALQSFVGLPLYFDNDEPDKRTQRKFTRRTYGETAEAYISRQEEYREKFSSGLPDSRKLAAESDIDQFFDEQVRPGYERLGELCRLLLQRLESGDTIIVLVKGFTSPRAKSEYNVNLGHRRVSSVINHIAEFGDGALQPYLKNRQLQVKETSFGETTARTGISDDLSDERNSIYHPDAARERRVEIVEIHSQTIEKKF